MNTCTQHILSTSLLTACLATTVHADPVQINSDTLELVPPEAVAQVSEFLERFVDSSKPPNEQIALYMDTVDYYDRGKVSKSSILRDMKRYRQQWPSRHYRVSRIDLIYPDPDSDSVYVRYEVNFTVANPAKAKRISGRGMYGAVIADIDGTPKISAIQESVLTRKRSSAIAR